MNTVVKKRGKVGGKIRDPVPIVKHSTAVDLLLGNHLDAESRELRKVKELNAFIKLLKTMQQTD
jgi:hypothetical protein